MSLPLYPFDGQLCVGTIIEVGPTYAKVNLPQAAIPESRWHHGHKQGQGEVGDFVLIEVAAIAIFGRIVNVRLPERERLTVEPTFGDRKQSHPVGTIQLLSTVLLQSGEVRGGLAQHPQLGSRVYAAHPRLVQWIAESSSKLDVSAHAGCIEIAKISAADGALLRLPPERLFGRHCAVLGATGGGKSWTVARLVEQAGRLPRAKVILLDATGEFHSLENGVRHVHLGDGVQAPDSSQRVVFPYWELTESDLFALFKPSGQTQAPKLRAAMKWLKVATHEQAIAPRGYIRKANQLKKPFLEAYRKHASAVNGPKADFAIAYLAHQITEECFFPTGRKRDPENQSRWVDDPERYGDVNEAEKSYCITLVTRIEDMVSSADLAPVLQPGAGIPLSGVVLQFLDDASTKVLRISLKHLSFNHNAREIVANAIGRYLLALARVDTFKTQPLVVFLDEAHQFLDKQLGDEGSRFPLDLGGHPKPANEGRLKTGQRE